MIHIKNMIKLSNNNLIDVQLNKLSPKNIFYMNTALNPVSNEIYWKCMVDIFWTISPNILQNIIEDDVSME